MVLVESSPTRSMNLFLISVGEPPVKSIYPSGTNQPPNPIPFKMKVLPSGSTTSIPEVLRN